MHSVLNYLPIRPGPRTPRPSASSARAGCKLNKLFSLTLSYFWPWTQDPSGNFTFHNDDFVVTFMLEKGVIPVVNIWGYISYERTNFISTIIQQGSAQG